MAGQAIIAWYRPFFVSSPEASETLAFACNDDYPKQTRVSNNSLTPNLRAATGCIPSSTARLIATIGRIAVSRQDRSVGIIVMNGISRSGSRGAFPRPARRWSDRRRALRLAFHAFPVKADDTTAIAFFEKSIRPLIVAKCQSCHGEKKAKAGLRLTDRESLLKGGESGPAVVPASPGRKPADPRGALPRRTEDAAEAEAVRRRDRGARALGGVGSTLAVIEGRNADDKFEPDRRASRLVGVPARSRASRPRPSTVRTRWPMRSMPFSWPHRSRKGITPVRSGGPTDLDPPRHVRPDRPAADSGRGRGVRFRRFRRGVREGRRSAPGLAGLRRALGAALARRGPLRRLLRRRPEDPHRQLRTDRGLALSRLGRRCLQPRPSVRPVHRPSDRRRSDAVPRTGARSIRPG